MQSIRDHLAATAEQLASAHEALLGEGPPQSRANLQAHLVAAEESLDVQLQRRPIL
jgi:hypothetical protein